MLSAHILLPNGQTGRQHIRGAAAPFCRERVVFAKKEDVLSLVRKMWFSGKKGIEAVKRSSGNTEELLTSSDLELDDQWCCMMHWLLKGLNVKKCLLLLLGDNNEATLPHSARCHRQQWLIVFYIISYNV